MTNRLLAVLIIFPLWLTLTLVFRRHRQWLFYYLIAAFGFTIQLVFLAEYFGLDQLLVNLASFHVNLISKNIFHIPMELLSNGRFQIMLTDGSSSILKLGIECSAILESSIVISLILFYPLFNSSQKILRAIFGLVVTYDINILRLMIIVLMAYKFGPDYIFLAHAGVARVFFFLFELLLYWYLMTKPTVKSVGESIIAKQPLAEAAKVGHALRMRHAIAQVMIIFIVIGLSVSSFMVSDEWRKAFTQVARQNRPIIYQEETGMETDRGVLGETSEGNRLDQSTIKDLAPGEEWKVRQSFLEFEQINIQVSEGRGPIALEVYLNDVFQNRAIVETQGIILDHKVFDKEIEVNDGDILEIRVKNIGNEPSSYLIDILKEVSNE